MLEKGKKIDQAKRDLQSSKLTNPRKNIVKTLIDISEVGLHQEQDDIDPRSEKKLQASLARAGVSTDFSSNTNLIEEDINKNLGEGVEKTPSSQKRQKVSTPIKNSVMNVLKHKDVKKNSSEKEAVKDPVKVTAPAKPNAASSVTKEEVKTPHDISKDLDQELGKKLNDGKTDDFSGDEKLLEDIESTNMSAQSNDTESTNMSAQSNDTESTNTSEDEVPFVQDSSAGQEPLVNA